MTTSTAFTKGYFGRLTQGFGLPGLHGRNHYGVRFHDEGDGGGDGDAGGDAGGETGAGDHGGGGGVQAHEFKDDTGFVRLPGIKDPVAVKDLLQSHTLRSRHETGMKTLGQIAEMLTKQKGQPQRQQQQPAQRRRASDQNPDPLAQLEGNELPDGKAIAATLRAAYGQQIEPLIKVLPLLVNKTQGLEKALSTILGKEAQGSLDQRFASAVGALKLPKMGNADIPGADILKELAADIYHSHDDESQKHLTDEVLGGMVKTRFKAMQTFFRNYEKAQLEDARLRAKAKVFARPGQGTSANGQPQHALVGRNRSRNAANLLFDGVAPSGT